MIPKNPHFVLIQPQTSGVLPCLKISRNDLQDSISSPVIITPYGGLAQGPFIFADYRV